MTHLVAPIEAVAARHGLSPDAVATLWDALLRGGGRMAQFSHPDLGGMGQWAGGGMLQIGAMFDHALKARVAAACADLAAALAERDVPARRPPVEPTSTDMWPGDARPWWPADLGHPSASGSQDGMRYAYFAGSRRLAIEREGRVTLYDTGRHLIFGVSQGQGRGQALAFTADDGTVDLASLPVLAP